MTLSERINYASILKQGGNYLKAFDEYCKLLYDFPYGINFLSFGSYLLDIIVKANPDFEHENAKQYFFKGMLYFRKHNFQSSLEEFNIAINIDTKLDHALKYKALCLTHLKQYRLAIKYLYKAIKVKPYGEYYNDLSENYFMIGDMKLAFHFQEKAIKASPYNYGIWCNYGKLLGKTGDLVKAIIAFDKAIELDTNCYEALYNRAKYFQIQMN